MRDPAYIAKQALFVREREQAWALFASAPSMRFASVDDDGRPVLRTLSGVVLDGQLCFHGTDDGEKLSLVGREAVASCDEVIAQVPSYYVHPQLACPATTYYLSAIAEGRVERIDDLELKARVLTAMMKRYQPEGGYDEIRPDDRRYATLLERLMVAALRPTKLSAKHKLGQHRSRAQIESVLAGLWQRGAPGDLRAIRLVHEAHPASPQPAFLCGPGGSVLCVWPDAADAEQVAAMLVGQYWTSEFSESLMADAQRGSTAWVVARDPASKQVLASARAISDRARFGYVLDVIVRPELRRQGFGQALMKLLLDHPALRTLKSIGLRTNDAQGLYGKLGFQVVEHPAGSSMALLRK